MQTSGLIQFGTAAVPLKVCPIHQDWVLEGDPIARHCVLSTSADGSTSTLIWDCTAGRFNWFYDVDETVYVLEGSVTVQEPGGAARVVSAGETIFFQAGARAEWTVDTYIRKVAFCRTPLPDYLIFAQKVVRRLGRLFGGGAKSEGAPAMFRG